MLDRGVLMALVLAGLLMYIYLALMTIGCSILYNIMTKKTTSYDWTLLPPILLVAAAVSRDIAAGLVACSQLIGQCVREDIAAMFSQFHMEKVALGGKFLKLSKEKGWLIPPPLHKSKNTDC